MRLKKLHRASYPCIEIDTLSQRLLYFHRELTEVE